MCLQPVRKQLALFQHTGGVAVWLSGRACIRRAVPCRAQSLIPGTTGWGRLALRGKDLCLHHLWERCQAATWATSSWKDILFSFWCLLLLTTSTHWNVRCCENKCSCVQCLTHFPDKRPQMQETDTNLVSLQSFSYFCIILTSN